MRDEIISELNKLIGLKFQYGGRASNLFWLGFGEMITVKRLRETNELAEYALHIQCSWRITKSNKILVASRDLYSPNSEWDEENEDFDWDVQGNNRFDERIKSLMEDVKETLDVRKIESDEVGGLKVFFTENYVLEIFPDISDEDEYSEFWRFINFRDKSPHFVVKGFGIER